MCHSVGVLFCVTIIIQTLRHKHLIDLISWLHIGAVEEQLFE